MKRKATALGCLAAMGLILLDGQTAQAGVREGLRLCAGAVVPALLPFFVLSNLLTQELWGQSGKLLRSLGMLFRMPEGAECLLIPAFLGGYPAGAGAVGQAYVSGGLTKDQAQRLLGWCSNVGPAFLFGIVAGAFGTPAAGWRLWGLQILGALAAARLLPGDPGKAAAYEEKDHGDLLSLAALTIGKICVTVILFRVILCYMAKFFPMDGALGVILGGLLELTNGCCDLKAVPIVLRESVAGGLMALGGVCVLFQTKGVTEGLRLKYYFAGKGIQALVCILGGCLKF